MAKATKTTATPTTAITWAIAQLERQTADGFVFHAHWTTNARDGSYSAAAYGSIGLERPENLIPFADLTESLVVGWVKDTLGKEKVEQVEAALQEQIDQKRTPTQAAGVPW